MAYMFSATCRRRVQMLCTKLLPDALLGLISGTLLNASWNQRRMTLFTGSTPETKIELHRGHIQRTLVCAGHIFSFEEEEEQEAWKHSGPRMQMQRKPEVCNPETKPRKIPRIAQYRMSNPILSPSTLEHLCKPSVPHRSSAVSTRQPMLKPHAHALSTSRKTKANPQPFLTYSQTTTIQEKP